MRIKYSSLASPAYRIASRLRPKSADRPLSDKQIRWAWSMVRTVQPLWRGPVLNRVCLVTSIRLVLLEEVT